jgi:hypothetical protein
MRDAVRRLAQLRPPNRIVQVRVPTIIAGRRGLPVLLSAFAVIAAASTAATTTVSDRQVVAAPAGTTVLPPVAPPTYSYGDPSGATPGAGGATAPGGTGLNRGGLNGAPAAAQLAAGGIPARAVQAYQAAATAAGCGLPWTLLAAIGRVESNHGRFGGATLLADGRSDPPIVGIPLDGRPDVAVIRDTDGGRYDADKTYDRAVGPMQFIPSSWASFGVDGDGDGKADPFDLDDAATAAGKYLCRAGGDLSTVTGQRNAVYSYNRSTSYVDQVLALAAEYAGGAPVDGAPAPGGAPLPPITPPTLPPVGFGPPPAASTTTPPSTPAKPKPTSPAPTGHSTSPAPTGHPSSPTPTTRPTSPTPTSPSSSPTGSPTSPSTSPTPTCTPVPSTSPTPSGSGTITPEGVGTETASGAAASTSPSASGAADASGTPTPSPSPTLPPCPS